MIYVHLRKPEKWFMTKPHNILYQLCLRGCMVSITIPLPCLKLCNALFRVMADHNQLFRIYTQTLHMTYTNPNPLY